MSEPRWAGEFPVDRAAEPGARGRSGVWVILVAGGAGARFGSAKQFAPLAGRRVLDWSLDAARSVADGVVLVVPAHHELGRDTVSGGPAGGGPDRAGADRVVLGGATRAASVRAGLAVVPDRAEVVVVHDAARPLAGPDLFGSVVGAVRAGAAGALPGLAVSDTVKRLDPAGAVVATIDRAGLVLVQTPQAFSAEVLRRAHQGDPEATDDAQVVEAVGGRVVIVPGDPCNFKITYPHDMVLAAALLGDRADRASVPTSGT